jgi:hypothetical protein
MASSNGFNGSVDLYTLQLYIHTFRNGLRKGVGSTRGWISINTKTLYVQDSETKSPKILAQRACIGKVDPTAHTINLHLFSYSTAKFRSSRIRFILGSWIRIWIRIKVKSLIWIQISCRSVVADSHHFDVKQDPDSDSYVTEQSDSDPH